VVELRGCEPGKAVTDDEKCSGRPIIATADEHRKLTDDLVQNDRQIIQKRLISVRLDT